MRMSLRWRVTAFYVGSIALLFLVLAVGTHEHLDHELREEAVERVHPGHGDWVLHADFVNQEIDDIMGELFEIWSIIAIPVFVISLIVGMLLARNSLRPIHSLNQQLSGIGPGNLSERVQAVDVDPELRRLAGQVNGLLERVEEGYARLSSYSTTVAHELRTPIMLMRLQIEKAGKNIEPGLAEDLQEELARLSGYIERTLLSARAEQGKWDARPVDFDLAAAIRDLSEGHALLAMENHRAIRLDLPESLPVWSDPSAIRHIFDNLMVNALRHGSGDIVVRGRKMGRMVGLLVVNRIHGTADPMDRATGVGLGLRLVTALARALPGTRFATRHGHTYFAARLVLPSEPLGSETGKGSHPT